MAAWDPDMQVGGTVGGGFRVECGEITASDSSVVFPATQLHTLFGGMCACDLTEGNMGRIASICEGPVLQCIPTDQTGNTVVTWIAWGM